MQSSPAYQALCGVQLLCKIVSVLIYCMNARKKDSIEKTDLYDSLNEELGYHMDECYSSASNACRMFCRILQAPAKDADLQNNLDHYERSCDEVNKKKGCEKKESGFSLASILHVLQILQNVTNDHVKACLSVNMLDGNPLGGVKLVFTRKYGDTSVDDESRFVNQTNFDANTRTQLIDGEFYWFSEAETDIIDGKTYQEMLRTILQQMEQLQRRISACSEEISAIKKKLCLDD